MKRFLLACVTAGAAVCAAQDPGYVLPDGSIRIVGWDGGLLNRISD